MFVRSEGVETRREREREGERERGREGERERGREGEREIFHGDGGGDYRRDSK